MKKVILTTAWVITVLLTFNSCVKKSNNLIEGTNEKIGFEKPVTFIQAQNKFNEVFSSRLGVQENQPFRKEKVNGFSFEYHKSFKSDIKPLVIEIQNSEIGMENQSTEETPESITIYIYDSTGLVTNALVFDYTEAELNEMSQFVDGYISLHDINGGYIGSLENTNINQYEFVVEDDPILTPEMSLAPGCYRTCFFVTYRDLKSDCANDIYCDSICDFAPCNIAWAYQSATTCNRICRPFGNI